MVETISIKNLREQSHTIDALDSIDHLSENDSITTEKLFGYLPLRDFVWWIFVHGELSINQRLSIMLILSRSSERMYKKYRPNDSSIKDTSETIEKLLKVTVQSVDAVEKACAAANRDAAVVSRLDTDNAIAMNYPHARYYAYPFGRSFVEKRVIQEVRSYLFLQNNPKTILD